MVTWLSQTSALKTEAMWMRWWADQCWWGEGKKLLRLLPVYYSLGLGMGCWLLAGALHHFCTWCPLAHRSTWVCLWGHPVKCGNQILTNLGVVWEISDNKRWLPASKKHWPGWNVQGFSMKGVGQKSSFNKLTALCFRSFFRVYQEERSQWSGNCP